MPRDPAYVGVQTGAASGADLGLHRDNTGRHISHKNANFCELTAFYWAWKNVRCDFIGIFHYRRFFRGVTDSIEHYGREIASGRDLHAVVRPNLFMTAPPVKFHTESNYPQSVESQFINAHGYEILIARQVIKRITPDYLDAFDILMRNNLLIVYNVILISKALFDSYCAWLFPILFAIEKGVQLKGRTSYQARMVGFIAERLLNVWLIHNQQRIELETREHVFLEI